MPRFALIDRFITDPIPPGLNLLVEFDSKSQWYAASLTIAAEWLKTGGEVYYNSAVQPPDAIRPSLNKLGVRVDLLEQEDKLRIYDIYTQTLGLKSNEKFAAPLKLAELSIDFSQHIFREAKAPERLRIWDNLSVYGRFNDEERWIEFELTRRLPLSRIQQSTLILAIVRGLHSDRAYKQLEAAVDGVIDFRLDEAGDQTRNLMRISSLRQAHFDSRWREVKFTNNYEATIPGGQM